MEAQVKFSQSILQHSAQAENIRNIFSEFRAQLSCTIS